jgi:hypothetical protein
LLWSRAWARFHPEIEPFVRLIEEMPRNRVLEEVTRRVKHSLNYRELLPRLLLAGVRSIQPRPVGSEFNAVLVVNSARLASLASPDTNRWLPIFDQYKASQAANAREGHWTIGGVFASMLLCLRTIVLLVLASLRVNAASVTGVIITKEAARSPAVNVAAVYQIQTRHRSGSTDLGSVVGAQNQTEETRTELEESLKTYRDLAKKEPETYLPHVAATLNDLGILDSNQNRKENARKEFAEALKTYRELAHTEAD